MSCLPNLFRKKKKNSLYAEMKENQKTSNMLMRQREYLEQQIADCIKLAKKNAKLDRPTALIALRQKKRLTNNLEKIECGLTRLKEQKDTIALAIRNFETLTAYNTSKCKPKKERKLINQMTKDNLLVNEMAATLNRYSFAPDMGEDELIQELEKLIEMEQLKSGHQDQVTETNKKVEETAVRMPTGKPEDVQKNMETEA